MAGGEYSWKGDAFDLVPSAVDCMYSLLQTSSTILTCHSGVVRALFRRWQYVYQIFIASIACQALASACTYSYFVLVWNKYCRHIQLKKTMRFTKCDTCILATESLDRARRNGGAGWESAAMTVIKRTLEDHYRVRVFAQPHDGWMVRLNQNYPVVFRNIRHVASLNASCRLAFLSPSLCVSCSLMLCALGSLTPLCSQCTISGCYAL